MRIPLRTGGRQDGIFFQTTGIWMAASFRLSGTNPRQVQILEHAYKPYVNKSLTILWLISLVSR